MAHIKLPEGLPGITGPMSQYPETEVHLSALAQTLLRGPSSITPAERELIAAYVSAGNECQFCTLSHAAAARELFDSSREIVDSALTNAETAPLSEKMKALLSIAGKVREDGKLVTDADILRAREAGADDRAIHDTVLIAAAFSMYNRYVDGLATWQPADPEAYIESGKRLATRGYQGHSTEG